MTRTHLLDKTLVPSDKWYESVGKYYIVTDDALGQSIFATIQKYLKPALHALAKKA